MNRQFDAAIYGDANTISRRRFSIVEGQRLCGWPCDKTSPNYARDQEYCPVQCVDGVLKSVDVNFTSLKANLTAAGKRGSHTLKATQRLHKKLQGQVLPRICAGEPVLPVTQASDLNPAHCGDNGPALLRKGVALLVGVMTGPAHEERRRAIRRTWKRWASSRVLVCFILGRRGLKKSQLRTLDAETLTHRDIIWLPNAADEGIPTLKGYAWWTYAASLLPYSCAENGLRYVAKVDDDSFVNLRNLEADVNLLHCRPNVYYGHMAYTGYDPTTWSVCGWSWQDEGDNYRKHSCARTGAHPPFPYINGELELLSAPLVRFIAISPEVREFVDIATRAIDEKKAKGISLSSRGGGGPKLWRQNEDIALGYWLHHGQQQHHFNITYVKINNRAANMACVATMGMYQRPRDDSVVVHFLKRPAGMDYLWGVLHDGVPHNDDNCTRYIWHNNCESDDAKTPFCTEDGGRQTG